MLKPEAGEDLLWPRSRGFYVVRAERNEHLVVRRDSAEERTCVADATFAADPVVAVARCALRAPAEADSLRGLAPTVRLRHLAGQLAQDTTVKMSAVSYARDALIAVTFLVVNPQDFQRWLLAKTGRIADSYPQRYKRFIPDGSAHTVLLYEEPTDVFLGGVSVLLGGLQAEVGGTNAQQWLTAMLDGTNAWQNLVDETLQ